MRQKLYNKTFSCWLFRLCAIGIIDSGAGKPIPCLRVISKTRHIADTFGSLAQHGKQIEALEKVVIIHWHVCSDQFAFDPHHGEIFILTVVDFTIIHRFSYFIHCLRKRCLLINKEEREAGNKGLYWLSQGLSSLIYPFNCCLRLIEREM